MNMRISIEQLIFTQPVQIDKTHYTVNIFHRDSVKELYAIMIVDTTDGISFHILRDIRWDDDESINKEIEMIKEYIAKTLNINYDVQMGLTVSMGMDIVKNGPDGKPIETKHIETKHIV